MSDLTIEHCSVVTPETLRCVPFAVPEQHTFAHVGSQQNPRQKNGCVKMISRQIANGLAQAESSETPRIDCDAAITDSVDLGLCAGIGRIFGAAQLAEKEPDTKLKTLHCKAAEALEAAHGKRVVILGENIAGEHNTSRKTWSRYVHACAGASVKYQQLLVDDLFEYLSNSSLKPLAWIQHVLYDETKMVLRTTYDTSMIQPPVVEICKTFVVESEWAVLVRCPEDYSTCQYMLLRGGFAPAVRVCNTKSSEGIRKVLESCPQAPRHVADLCKYFFRLVETDSDPANLKHEWYLQRDSAPMQTLHLPCTAHHLHRAAEHTWSLTPSLITGIVQVCMVMGEAQAMHKFEHALHEYVFTPGRVKRVLAGLALPQEANAYRRMLLELFLPPRTQPMRRAKVQAVFECILNGNLLAPSLEHYCSGPLCCSSMEHCQQRVFDTLRAMFYALRPGYFARNDWNAWHAPLRFFGLGYGAHKLLPFVFAKAFGSDDKNNANIEMHDAAQEAGGEQPAASTATATTTIEHDGDVAPDLRHQDAKVLSPQQKSKMKNDALEFMDSNWWADFLFLRTSTEAEITFMMKLLKSGSLSERSSCLCKEMGSETGSHPLIELSVGTWSLEALQFSYRTCTDREVWACAHIAETEAMRSKIMSVNMRTAACVWEGIHRKTSSYPLRLFSLLFDRSMGNARTILECPRCMQDTFTVSILQEFTTPEALLSDDLQQMLSAMAALALGCTFSTERLHSKNARRARTRVHVKRPDAADVGLAHQGWVGPAFLKPLEVPTAKRQQGRPKKTRKKTKKKESSKRKRVRVNALDDARKSRKGGGGAWRYHVYLHGHGGKFTGDSIKELASSYHSLSADTKAEYAELGRQGATFSDEV
eukprot:5828643-Amphidinium_carterae.2